MRPHSARDGIAVARSRWPVALCMAVALAMAAPSRAQQNAPRIGYAYPAGGQQGRTFEVAVGGQYLDNVRSAYVSGDGIQAKVLELIKPLPAAQLTELREQIQELQKKGKNAEILKEIEAIRAKITASQNRNSNPSISQTARLEISLALDAESGLREIRLKTPLGLSNPISFCVSRIPEYLEKDPKTIDDTVTEVSLPAVLNGQLIPGSVGRYRTQPRQQQSYIPGDVDQYRFAARKGQRLVASVSARELIPYLADAVPGWLQAVLTLYDSSGKEVACNDDFRFDPDPVLYYEVPQDGEYTIEIRDSLYRGREDFVYRITVGELPYLTHLFPLGGRAGTRIPVDASGWNLPAAEQTVDAGQMAPGIHSFSVKQGDFPSNPVPFMVDTAPECFEKEANNSEPASQQVKLPIIVNGRVDRPGDRDVFRFKGRAGDRIVAEVYARRLDSPLDSSLRLTDAKGRPVAFNDDREDRGSGLETHHADPYVSATLPADGTYYVHLEDVQRKGGPEYGYRLRISDPQPDFDLRIVPSAVNALVGPTVPVTVYALRKDGFDGDIALKLKNAPRGCVLSGGGVPAGMDRVQLTLRIPPASAKDEPVRLVLEGRAMIQGREVVKAAVPADDRMQAFAYRHLVPAKEWFANTAGRGPNQEALRILNDLPLKLSPGETVRVRLALPAAGALEKIQCELNEPPEGISIADAMVTAQGAEFVVQSDPAKARPGWKGNLIVSVSGERARPANDKPETPRRQRTPLGILPAIPLEIARSQ